MSSQTNYFLTFTGVGISSHYQPTPVTVLCGDNPPTITGGYAKWQTVPRPLTRGVTVFQGYDPIMMKCEVRFGTWQWAPDGSFSWDQSDAIAKKVEDDIETMSWMAGDKFTEGPSPAIYVQSFSSGGGVSPLIPREYGGGKFAWIITDLTWATSYRNNNGYRVRQDATVTLTQYNNSTLPPPKANTRANGGYFISKPGADTPLLIAAAPSSKSPIAYHEILARRIKNDPKNNALKLSSIRSQIKHGKKVWVPAHQI